MDQTPTPEGEPDPEFAALLGATQESERETLEQILTAGVDQGWFLRADADRLLVPRPEQAAVLHEVLSRRDPATPEVDDPWREAPPPVTPIAGEEPGWVILTQRCDLVRGYNVEPLVELARAVPLGRGQAATAKTNSPRLIAFAEGEGEVVWAADLRQRAWICKDVLLTQRDLSNPIAEPRARKRFRLRIGQRYWRDPVPDDLVETLQRPLRDAVKDSAARIAMLRNFSMWLGLRADDGKVEVLAVAQEGREAEAREDWQDILALLQERAPDAHSIIDQDISDVYSADDVSLGVWLDAFKFDFDELTFSRRAQDDHTTPDR